MNPNGPGFIGTRFTGESHDNPALRALDDAITAVHADNGWVSITIDFGSALYRYSAKRRVPAEIAAEVVAELLTNQDVALVTAVKAP